MMDDFTPNAPGTPQPGTPHTPSWGDGMDAGTPAHAGGDSAGVWQQPGVVVVVNGVDAKVVSAPDAQKQCQLRSLADMSEFSAAVEDMKPKKPVKKDRVVVTEGEHVGQSGTLIGIDIADALEDGIVKMDADKDIKIIEMSALTKYDP